jgi:hypothetical protein
LAIPVAIGDIGVNPLFETADSPFSKGDIAWSNAT